MNKLLFAVGLAGLTAACAFDGAGYYTPAAAVRSPAYSYGYGYYSPYGYSYYYRPSFRHFSHHHYRYVRHAHR